MPRWFITGTDTDAGKTAITAALAAGLNRLGFSVRAVKPLMSGYRPDESESDASRIARAAGHDVACHSWWSTPVSPHRAAWIEDKPLDIEHLRSWLQTHHADHVLVEGVGGWRVPLSMTTDGETQYAVRDLAQDTGGEVLVVAANKLGVLNHVTLTVEAIERDGFRVRGVILNQVRAHDESVSEKTNFDDLKHLLDVPVTTCPFISEFNRDLLGEIGERLWRELMVF